MATGTSDPWHRDGAFFGWDAASDAQVTTPDPTPDNWPSLHAAPAVLQATMRLTVMCPRGSICLARTQVTQERRVYMSGLSDEAGAGAGLAMAVKQVGSPEASEIAKLEEYVNSTLYQVSMLPSDRRPHSPLVPYFVRARAVAAHTRTRPRVAQMASHAGKPSGARQLCPSVCGPLGTPLATVLDR